eukprot:COSAG01_NODE_3163_length_6477_cov_140.457981_3_plen_86_part_00
MTTLTRTIRTMIPVLLLVGGVRYRAWPCRYLHSSGSRKWDRALPSHQQALGNQRQSNGCTASDMQGGQLLTGGGAEVRRRDPARA